MSDYKYYIQVEGCRTALWTCLEEARSAQLESIANQRIPRYLHRGTLQFLQPCFSEVIVQLEFRYYNPKGIVPSRDQTKTLKIDNENKFK